MLIYPGTDGRQMETDGGEEPSASGTTAGKREKALHSQIPVALDFLSSLQKTNAVYVGNNN